MKKWEKQSFTWWALSIGVLLLIGITLEPLHLQGAIGDAIEYAWAGVSIVVWGPWGWFNVGLTIRDILRRDFRYPWIWILIVLATFGIGWLVYLYRYGWRDRDGEPVDALDGNFAALHLRK